MGSIAANFDIDLLEDWNRPADGAIRLFLTQHQQKLVFGLGAALSYKADQINHCFGKLAGSI